MSSISSFGTLRRAFAWAALVLAPIAAAGMIGTATPASADGQMVQGMQPPAYKYQSQYARKSGMYLNLGNIAYVRVPTIRLRAGAVKFREVLGANNYGGQFVVGGGHYRPGPAKYHKRKRIIIAFQTPYYYRPYRAGGPFYGVPTGYVANYWGMPGYAMPNGRPPYMRSGYGPYGFNTERALQGLPRLQRQPGYRGSFNAPSRIVAAPQQPRPLVQPRFVRFDGATVKSGNLPIVHKPAGKHLIRVE